MFPTSSCGGLSALSIIAHPLVDFFRSNDGDNIFWFLHVGDSLSHLYTLCVWKLVFPHVKSLAHIFSSCVSWLGYYIFWYKLLMLKVFYSKSVFFTLTSHMLFVPKLPKDFFFFLKVCVFSRLVQLMFLGTQRALSRWSSRYFSFRKVVLNYGFKCIFSIFLLWFSF